MGPIAPDQARRLGLAAIGALWLLVVGWLTWPLWPSDVAPPGTVVVVHWANGHMAGDDALLPALSQRFNDEERWTRGGRRIVVRPYLVNSGVIQQELLSRVQGRGRIRRELPDPALVTPVAEHWVHHINHAHGSQLVEADEASSLALTWIGIATFKNMAECLGWPAKDLGYADIIALTSSPAGWGSMPCARAEWGRRPLLTYTDPNRSSTGRTVLFTLFSIALGKAPERLTTEDLVDPQAANFLRTFQSQVDHYVPDTLLLNCEIFGGPSYGHFFPIAEDNLVKLYQGKVVQTDPDLERLFPCRQSAGTPIAQDMVMLYPKEGATAHTHPAAAVNASWVSQEQREAAQVWVAFLRQDAQQREFMAQGFRPATRLAPTCPICPDYGLQPSGPKVRIDPNRIRPEVGQRAVAAWGDLKKTGVVVFVVDGSLAMAGTKIDRARDGVIQAIDQMYDRNLVGLVTMSAGSLETVPVAPLPENRFAVADRLRSLRVSGGAPMFDAIATAIDLAARAPVGENAIRGVVVLAGGPATTGMPLTDLVEMVSPEGRRVGVCQGFGGETQCADASGRSIDRTRVRGVRLLRADSGAVKVYFIGIGMDEQDLDVGRILAEATGSNVVGTTPNDLAAVIGVFKGYF